MRIPSLCKIGVLALSVVVFVTLGVAKGDCPNEAVAYDSVTVETKFGTFEVDVCVTYDPVNAQNIYTFIVTNVDLECPIQSFGVHPFGDGDVVLEASSAWQTENDEPSWWMWDGPSWQAIWGGSSREFSLRIADSRPVASLAGAVFTTPTSTCGGNELGFELLGAVGTQQEIESHGGVVYGQLCTCRGAQKTFPSAQRISVPHGYRAEYFVPPTGLSDPNDVLVRSDGSILVVSARMEAIQEVELDGTIRQVATMEGYDLEVDGAGKLYGYSIVSGTVFVFDSAMRPRAISELPGTVFGSPLAVTPDGTLFIAHNATTPSGIGSTTLFKLRPEEPTPVAVSTLPEFVTALKSGEGGELYAVTSWGQWLSKIDPVSGRIEHLCPLRVNDVGYHGLAVDSDGTVYVATDEGSFSNAVYRIRPSCKLEELARFDNGRIEGIAIREDGSLVAVQALAGALYVIEPNGTVQAIIAPNGLVTPHSLAFSPCGDLVVVADEAGILMDVCPDGEVKPFAEAITFQPPQTFVAFAPDGRCVVGEAAPGFPSRVSIYTPSGERSTLAASLESASGVAIGSDGSVYVSETGAGRILQLYPDGREEVFADDLPAPQALTLSANDRLYAIVNRKTADEVEASTYGDAVVEILSDGTARLVAEIFGCTDLVLDEVGYIYVATAEKIWKIDKYGSHSVFASGFSGARGVAFFKGDLYIADDVTNAIVRIVRAGKEEQPQTAEPRSDRIP